MSLNISNPVNANNTASTISIEKPRSKDFVEDGMINIGGGLAAAGASAPFIEMGRHTMQDGAFEGQGIGVIPKALYNVAIHACEGYNWVVDQVVTPISQSMVETLHIHSPEAPEKAATLAFFIGAGAAICGVVAKGVSNHKKNQLKHA